jgi:translocation-and-assembly-module (TAM) inner membrane subunit TamB-like protein
MNPSDDKTEFEPARPRRFWWRWLRRFLIFAAIIFALVLGLYLFRGPLLAKPLGDLAGDQLSSALGGQFTIESIEGNWYENLVIRGLETVEAPSEGPIRELTAPEITLSYRLLDFFDERPTSGLKSLVGRGMTVRLDLAAPSTADALEETEAGSEPLDLRDIAALIPDGLPHLDLEGRLALALPEDDRASLHFELLSSGANALALSVAELELPKSLSKTLELPPRIELRLEQSDRVHFDAAVTPELLGLSPIALRAELPTESGRDDLLARAELGILGGTATLEAQLGPEFESIVSQFDLKGLRLGELPASWRKLLAQDTPTPQSGTLRLSSRLEGKLDASALRAQLDLYVEEFAFGPDARIDSLRLAGLGEMTLNLALQLPNRESAALSAEFRAQDTLLRANSIELALGDEPALGRLDEVRLEVRDLAARARALIDTENPLPWPRDPVHLDLLIEAPEGDPRQHPIVVETAELRSGEARAALSGRLQLPADLATDEAIEKIAFDFETIGAIPALTPLIEKLDLGAELRGALDWNGTLTGTSAAPVADLSARIRDGRLDEFELGSGDLDLGFAEQTVNLRRLQLRGGIAQIDGAAQIGVGTGRIEGGRLEVGVPSLQPFLRFAPEAPAVEAALDLRARIAKSAGLWTEGWDADADGSAKGLRFEGQDLGRARFAFRMQDTLADLRDLRLEGPLGRVRAGGELDLSAQPPGLRLKTLSGEALDLSRISALAPESPALAGRIDFEGTATKALAAPWESIDLRGRFDLQGLVAEAQEIGDLTLRIEAADRVFALSDLRARGPWGEVRAAARAELDENGAGRATLSALEGQVEGQAIRLRDTASIDWTAEGRIAGEELDLEIFGGRVQGRLAHDGQIDAQLEGIGFDLGTLPILQSRGKIDLNLLAQGDLSAPRFNLQLQGRDLAHAEFEKLGFELSLGQDAAGLRAEKIRVVGPGLSLSGGGALPLRLGSSGAELLPWNRADFGMRLEVQGRDAGTGATETLFQTLAQRLQLEPQYDFTQLALDLDLKGGSLRSALRLDAPRAGEDFAALLPAHLTFDLSSSAALTTLKLTAPPTGGFRFSGEGQVEAGIGHRLADDPLAAFRSAPLRFDLDLNADDLAPFAKAAPDLVRLAGRLEAQLGIRGRTDDLRPRARVVLRDLAARTDSDLPSLTAGQIRLALDDRLLKFEEARFELGHTPVALSGSVDFGAAWEEPQLDLVVDGKNTLLARNEDLRLRADLDLAITGPLQRMNVGGKVVVTDALFTKPITLTASGQPSADDRFQIFSLRRPPLSNIQFDLDIEADRTIRLANNLINGFAAANLHLIGDGAVPKPEGRIDFSGLRVALPFSKLRLERGAVIFDAADPFSPRLAISGRTKMRGFDLEVDVSGRLPDQRVVVRADPFLPQEDALSLLTVGNTRSGLAQEGLGGAVLTRAGSLLTDSLFEKIFGPGDPEEEGLADRFSVEIGRDVSRTGASTLEVEYRAMKRIFLRAERDRYDDYNLDLVWRLRFR